MSRLLKYAIVLALAVAIGSYIVLGPVGLDEFLPSHPERAALAAHVEPTPPASPASIDEELDYMVAKRLASLEGWRAFLAAHANGTYAQSARAEVERRLGADNASAPTAPDDPTALSAGQAGAAGNGDRAALSPNAAAPAPPSAAPDQNVDVAPPAILAKAAPTAPDGAAARVVAGLPKLAPVRVILNVARDDSGRARRSADIRQALAAAGLEVADHIPVDAQRPGPSIGYYFQSDRNAAAEVSHLLEPLLGAVDPVAIRKRGSIPEPGTIEIAIP